MNKGSTSEHNDSSKKGNRSIVVMIRAIVTVRKLRIIMVAMTV